MQTQMILYAYNINIYYIQCHLKFLEPYRINSLSFSQKSHDYIIHWSEADSPDWISIGLCRSFCFYSRRAREEDQTW